MEYSYLSDSVEVKKVEEDDKKGVFHIEGLYTGYGQTIGNALRRVLLSSIPGAAISKVKVKDVEHEFSTIPGMKEDVVEFTLNLKQVKFNFMADEPQVLQLNVNGSGEVTAGDIEETTMVEVVNPDTHIAQLTDDSASLEAELTVEKGLGYQTAEERKSEESLPIGTIMLDCIFSPIENVNFEIENMRVEEKTDYNRVKLTIETDGSILPSEALHKAGSILEDHFSAIISQVSVEGSEKKNSEEDNSEEDNEEE
ncbi:MAG: DNA-directed RNA polymerase subunit alpha [Candidatus Magasanikbacteria bacterium]